MADNTRRDHVARLAISQYDMPNGTGSAPPGEVVGRRAGVPHSTGVPQRTRCVEPLVAVVVFFATQCVRDLMKKSLLGIVRRPQRHNVSRQRDFVLVVMARSSSATGVVPAEAPLMFQARKVLRDEPLGESLNLRQINHTSTICNH